MTHRMERYAEAYLRMAKEARYRPKAPGDGCGNVSLTAQQAADRERLDREAWAYAEEFDREENDLSFIIGCSDFVKPIVPSFSQSRPLVLWQGPK